MHRALRTVAISSALGTSIAVGLLGCNTNAASVRQVTETADAAASANMATAATKTALVASQATEAAATALAKSVRRNSHCGVAAPPARATSVAFATAARVSAMAARVTSASPRQPDERHCRSGRPTRPSTLPPRPTSLPSARRGESPPAADYTAGPDVHPAVIIEQTGTNTLYKFDDISLYNYARGWVPQSFDQTSLIACIEHRYVVVGVCNYHIWAAGAEAMDLHRAAADPPYRAVAGDGAVPR